LLACLFNKAAAQWGIAGDKKSAQAAQLTLTRLMRWGANIEGKYRAAKNFLRADATRNAIR
jgi:hypothetical protein